MTEPEVVALMESSSNEQEWNDNADKIKATFGGYPGFWWSAIMLSGIANRVQKSWISTTVEGLLDPLMKEDKNAPFTSIKLMPPDEQEIEQIKRKMRERNEF